MFKKKRSPDAVPWARWTQWLVPAVCAAAALFILLNGPEKGTKGPTFFNIGSLRGKQSQAAAQPAVTDPAAAVQRAAASPAAAAPAAASPAAAPVAASPAAAPVASSPAAAKEVLVPVTLFIMANCPDAAFCVTQLDRVIRSVPTLVTVRTEYIATVPEGGGEVTCMHGEEECAANKQQLCLQAKIWPSISAAMFWPALVCHMRSSPGSDLAPLRSCMHNSSLSAVIQQTVLACASGAEGKALQVASANKVKESKVVKSCTVFIDDKKRCIRDGGRYYDCPGGDSDATFTKTICDAYKAKGGQTPPPACT